ncbi:MAG: START domain-containing protein [Pseudomonadota bacterium]
MQYQLTDIAPPKPVLALLVLLLIWVTPAAGEEWTRLIDTNELQVDSRPYPGSSLQEVRGVIYLETSLNAVMALLKDADYNEQWVFRSGGARVVKEEGYERAYVHGVVDAPWPMQDRDTVVRFDYEQADDGDITISIVNFPDFLPVTEPYVRVPDFGGFWKLKPVGGGCVEVTYQVYGDPGGWVPVWMANYAAQTSVARTLENMPRAVKRYRDAHSDKVREVDNDGARPVGCLLRDSLAQAKP